MMSSLGDCCQFWDKQICCNFSSIHPAPWPPFLLSFNICQTEEPSTVLFFAGVTLLGFVIFTVSFHFVTPPALLLSSVIVWWVLPSILHSSLLSPKYLSSCWQVRLAGSGALFNSSPPASPLLWKKVGKHFLNLRQEYKKCGASSTCNSLTCWVHSLLPLTSQNFYLMKYL